MEQERGGVNMSMEKWAENEIRIACERERAGASEDEWDYGVACYESAYKAFKSLLEDGHSGMSISITKNILNRLIDGKPLTPIEDDPDIWNHVNTTDEFESYQCKRMSSLFKDVYADGTVKYSDVQRIVGMEVNDNIGYYSGFICDIVDELLPITMPYSPTTQPYKVYTETFLVNQKNGDFDTRAVLYIIHPDGQKTEVNRFFKDAPDGWKEITLEEYNERKKNQINRR